MAHWPNTFCLSLSLDQKNRRMYKIFFRDRVLILREGTGSAPAPVNREEVMASVDRLSQEEGLKELVLTHSNLPELQQAVRSCFTLIEAGGGVVFNNEGQFLVIERNGTWDLPKGKMEPGEDFESTALREVEEETGLEGLELKNLLMSTFHTYELKGKKILKETQWFEMYYPGKDRPVLQSEEGITDWRWVKPGESGFIRANTYASILDVLKIRDLI